MKTLMIIAIVSLAASTPLRAENFEKNAKSGKTTWIHTYKSWTGKCEANEGVVKVVSKPSHGTLTPRQVDTTIGESRHHPGKNEQCKGTAIPGFRVEYTSDEGFTGVDRFQIEAHWGKKTKEVDTYTVNVK